VAEKKSCCTNVFAKFSKFGPLLQDLANCSQEMMMRHQMGGESQAQQGMTSRRTLLFWQCMFVKIIDGGLSTALAILIITCYLKTRRLGGSVQWNQAAIVNWNPPKCLMIGLGWVLKLVASDYAKFPILFTMQTWPVVDEWQASPKFCQQPPRRATTKHNVYTKCMQQVSVGMN
jgi:hypothetical protein